MMRSPLTNDDSSLARNAWATCPRARPRALARDDDHRGAFARQGERDPRRCGDSRHRSAQSRLRASLHCSCDIPRL